MRYLSVSPAPNLGKTTQLPQSDLTPELEFCTASNNGRQKIRPKISVIKANSFDWELLTFDDIKKIVHFGILIHFLS